MLPRSVLKSVAASTSGCGPKPDVDPSGEGVSRACVMEATGSEGVPRPFVAGRLGGFEAVKNLDRSGDLDRLVRA